MLQKLIDQLDYYLRTAFSPNPELAPVRCYDQAYGMVQMFILICPDLDAKVSDLWDNEYFPEFERAIYGFYEDES